MTVSTKPSKPLLVGVAGGSGSGKTYFTRAVQQNLGEAFCQIIYQDNFYFDQSKNFDHDGGSVNFDHPDSIDFALLAACLSELKQGREAQLPVYDFVSHTRRRHTIAVRAAPVILVDGILIFHSPLVRSLFDERIFFDTPEKVRFQRRLDRDVRERGRTPEGVERQFQTQVQPMHAAFVEPSKAHAHYVVNDENMFSSFVQKCCTKFKGSR